MKPVLALSRQPLHQQPVSNLWRLKPANDLLVSEKEFKQSWDYIKGRKRSYWKRRRGEKKTPSTTCVIKLRQHKNPADTQEPKIYSSPFCEAPWLTAALTASPNSRCWLAMLAPPLKADDKFTGAHISGLVAAHIATASPDVQIATPSSWLCNGGCWSSGVFSLTLRRHGSMQSVGPGWQCFSKCAIWLTGLGWCNCIIHLLMASQLKFCHSHTFLLQQSGRKDSYWGEP